MDNGNTDTNTNPEPERTGDTTETGQTGQAGQAGQQSPGEAWRDVGEEFRSLGSTLAAALRSTLQSDETRGRVRDMQSGVEDMIKQVGNAIKDTTTSPQAQQLRNELGEAVGQVRVAGESTINEVRPRLVSALHQLNIELQKLADRMQSEDQPGQSGQGQPTVQLSPPQQQDDSGTDTSTGTGTGTGQTQ